MSYVRWGPNSNVYVYACDEMEWQIRSAKHPEMDSVHTSPGETAARLIELRSMGHKVPQYAIDALLDEQREMDEAASKEGDKT